MLLLGITLFKKIKLKNCLLYILVFLHCQSLEAQSSEQAIDLLRENKHTDALDMLKQVQASGKNKAKASLALSVIEADDEHYLKAFNDFQLFCQYYPDPYPYFYALNSIGVFNKGECIGNNDVEFFLKKLLSDPKANATVRSCAINILAGNKEREGDFKAARKIYANISDIKNWSTVGVFENVAGSGFNKDFGVVTHPEADYKFTNNLGATVQWFDIPEVRNDRWQDLTNSHNISDALIYSQTFIKSDQDTNVFLKIGISGSLKVWLNDYQIASENEERNTDADVLTYQVKIQKGINRLLLQTGSSEINNNNFLVRLTDLNGNLLTNIKSDSHFEPYTKAQPYEINQIPFFAEKYFEDLVARYPDNLINQSLLLEVYNHNERKYEALKVLKELKKIAPHSSFVSGKVIATENFYGNINVAKDEKEYIKTNDSECLKSLIILYGEAFEKANWSEALRLQNKRIALFGETPFVKFEFIGLTKKKNQERLNAEVDNAYKKYYDDEKIVEIKSLFCTANKDTKNANAVLEEYLKAKYSEDVMDMLIENDLRASLKTTYFS